MTFKGKSVLVTGGSRGIGKAISLRFAEQGARRVAVSYLRNDKAAEETAEEISKLGAEPLLLRGNLGDPDKTRALLEETGPLDVIVSNAATGGIRPFQELDEKHWDWTLNANARALFTIAREAAPTMPAGSSIVAISSLGADRVLANYMLVGVSKATLEALVRYLAVELAPQDIRVNAVSAGLVETGALDYFPNPDDMLPFYRDRPPAGRPLAPPCASSAGTHLRPAASSSRKTSPMPSLSSPRPRLRWSVGRRSSSTAATRTLRRDPTLSSEVDLRLSDIVTVRNEMNDRSVYPLGKRRTLIVFFGLMLGMLLAAIDQTIVSTALPRITQDLGGFEHYSWVFSAYMLGATVTVPLYGKLSDIYGRRPLFLIGIALFSTGSIVCGLSVSMGMLIAGRAIQGLGAGGLIPLAVAAIGDIIPPRSRGKWQGVTGVVFAASSVLGPAVGGWVTARSASGRWLFACASLSV